MILEHNRYLNIQDLGLSIMINVSDLLDISVDRVHLKICFTFSPLTNHNLLKIFAFFSFEYDEMMISIVFGQLLSRPIGLQHI